MTTKLASWQLSFFSGGPINEISLTRVLCHCNSSVTITVTNIKFLTHTERSGILSGLSSACNLVAVRHQRPPEQSTWYEVRYQMSLYPPRRYGNLSLKELMDWNIQTARHWYVWLRINTLSVEYNVRYYVDDILFFSKKVFWFTVQNFSFQERVN